MIRSAIALLLVACTVPSVSMAKEPGYRRVQLKQGCVFNCPDIFTVLDKANVAKISTAIDEIANSSTPAFKEKVESASLVFAAADNQGNPKGQLTLLLLPAELSQAELKEFSDSQKNQLRELMHQQSAPQFARFGIEIQKKWPAEIREGTKLSYFLWGYEFVDGSKVPQVSLRAYYYTQKATFILGMSCHKTFFDANSKQLLATLASLETAL